MFLPALQGISVHAAIEAVVRALGARGCRSAASPEGVAALEDLGGYTEVVRESIRRVLAEASLNPRASAGRDYARLVLERAIPEMRASVQRVIARCEFNLAAVTPNSDRSRLVVGVHSLSVGTHAEVTLQHGHLPLAGRVDLIAVSQDGAEIVDFKSGLHSPDHADQLEFYAVLWLRDTESNPDRRPIATLSIRYATNDVSVAPPTSERVSDLEASYVEEITAGLEAITETPPRANVDAEHCGWCPVRHLCDEFWSKHPLAHSGPDAEWLDIELEVVARNGPSSWLVKADESSKVALLRVSRDAPPLAVGARARILYLRNDGVDAEDRRVFAMAPTTEVFLLH